MNKIGFLASFLIAVSPPAFSDDLTITQNAIAAEMYATVLTFATTSRLQDMCAEVEVDMEKLSERRSHLMTLAQSEFASQEDFMKAAGSDEQEKMGESMRRYFLERGVSWDSAAAEYCELAEVLIRSEAPLSKYFTLTD